MKTPRKVSRNQVFFAAFLIFLTLLSVLLWLNDPHATSPVDSRVEWPAAPASKS